MVLDDEHYMLLALAEAKKAYSLGEIPIGAVLVNNEDGTVVSAGYNLRESKRDATAHAEMEAIRSACRSMNRWRLSGLTLYVTIEPCAMCAGALVNSRVDRLVYGSTESKFGAVESIFNIVNHKLLNHRMAVTAGVMEEECRQLMKDFFKMRREQNRAKKAAEKAMGKVAEKSTPAGGS